MPDPDDERRADGQRDAGDADGGRPEPEEDPPPPKAVPVPSLASRDMPVPKPVRRAPPGANIPRATPVPSPASRDAPVPRPVRPATPARGVGRATPVPGGPVKRTSGTIFDDRPAAPPACPPPRGAEPEPPEPPQRTSFTSVKKTTRPGSTQAMRIGPGDEKKPKFTRQLIRSEDRVTIKDDIPLAYRFLDASGPDLYPDTHRGWLVDLSLTGAQIEGILPPAPQRRDLLSGAVVMRLKIELPYVEEPLVIDAQVTWVKPAEAGVSLVGLKFSGVTQQQSNLIRAFFIGLQSPARTKFRRGRPEGPA